MQNHIAVDSHGEAMCAVMDYVIGWAAFFESGTPWSGATVQVNVRLCKPVPVHAMLQIEGRVMQKEARKTWVDECLVDEDGVVYARAEGLTVRLMGESIAKMDS